VRRGFKRACGAAAASGRNQRPGRRRAVARNVARIVRASARGPEPPGAYIVFARRAPGGSGSS